MNLIERHTFINNILLSGINIELIKAYNESLKNYNINPDGFKEVILNKIRNYNYPLFEVGFFITLLFVKK